MTEVEKRFIYKGYESKIVNEMTHLRNAVLNAINNATKGKNKKFIELFKKKQAKADVEYNKNAMELVYEIEEKEGKSWVEKLYQNAGLKTPRKG